MQHMGIVFKLRINPVFEIIRSNHLVTPLAPCIGELQRIAATRTRLVITINASTIARPYDKMVAFSAYWMTTPTNDSALVTVDGSGGSGHLFLNDIERDHNRTQIGPVGDQIADSEQDLPRHEAGEHRRREGERRPGVVREEAFHGHTKRLSGILGGKGGGEIGEIGGYSGIPASPLQRPAGSTDLYHVFFLEKDGAFWVWSVFRFCGSVF